MMWIFGYSFGLRIGMTRAVFHGLGMGFVFYDAIEEIGDFDYRVSG